MFDKNRILYKFDTSIVDLCKNEKVFLFLSLFTSITENIYISLASRLYL